MGDILLSLIVAVVASFVTVHLSLRSFHRQKLWKKKEEAYSDILSALFDMKAYYSDAIEREIMREKSNTDLIQRHRKAIQTLERHVDIGALVVSHEAVYELADLKTSRKQEINTYRDDPMGALETGEAASDQCLTRMIAIARKDLETTASFFGGVFDYLSSFRHSL